jgi:tetratricopeptide (TPR) repeat protein
MPRREHLVYIFLLVAITLGVYYDSLGNGFVYDDYPFLVDNPAVRELNVRGISERFSQPRYSSSSAGLSRDVWRPLMSLSFALDYRLWGLDSRSYHIENTLLHLANACLVYAASVMIISDPFASFIASVVFAIHPAQTEAVAWVSGRSNVLFLLFFLSAFIAHVRRRRGDPSRSFSFGAALAFFALALFSKEMAIALPLALILYDAFFFRSRRPIEYVKYYLPFFLVAASYLAARLSVVGAIAQRSGWWAGDPASAAAMVLKTMAAYVRLAIFPSDLGIDYSPDVARAFAGTSAVSAALTVAAIAAICWSLRRKRKVVFFVLWFFVTLIPVYNIVPFKAIMAERFLYLPLIGYCALFGLLFAYVGATKRLDGWMKAAAGIALASVVTAYGFISISRNIEWRDEMAFYGGEASRSPSSAKARYNYAYICAKEAAASADRERAASLYALAASEYAKAISLKPDSQISYIGMGNVCSAVGMYDEAIASFRKALSIEGHADIYNNLAAAYLNKGMYGEAGECLRKALLIDPNHANALVNLGNVYYASGEAEKARLAWRRAVRLGADPEVVIKITGAAARGGGPDGGY